MKKKIVITHLFVDIGGVLLTNGWDRHTRKRAATHFKLNWDEMENRHHLIFEAFEEGKFTLDEYLAQVVFYQKRSFTPTQFKEFMFAQSKALPNMLELIRTLKAHFGLKVIVVSNEARELNDYRIKQFRLGDFVDAFVSSSFVHVRKPDPEIFRLALDIGYAQPEHVLYIENTPMFIQIAERFGIHTILHTDYESTCAQLAPLGLNLCSEEYRS